MRQFIDIFQVMAIISILSGGLVLGYLGGQTWHLPSHLAFVSGSIG